ncbi:MAG TPA: formylglycine-generating enzyme family protein [Candidatus Acidoferrum sp.]|jgi:formylglycine-generating enzyme required for sulfatase activity|nr:formylglycine-generating enzyme family protein [Candidatus Acidoferrum sp.]
MKTRCSKLVPFHSVLFLALWAVAPLASAQVRSTLGLGFSAGQPTLSLTGEVGTVYSIQYATGLSPTNFWEDRTLLQAQAASTVWSDPSAPTPGQRFYRAVSVAAPADTNLVFIQPGTFAMGCPTNEAERISDETQHTVTISRGFWMERFLVTQGDYLAVVGSNPSHFRNGTNAAFGGTGSTITNELRHPVEEVSWNDATNYCALRTQQERAGGLIPTNYVYRLPTESEWEYACRAGTTAAFYLGSSLHSGQANFDGLYEYDSSVGTINNPSGIFLGMTTPVGNYAANPWGLYDMIGNVWEWCQDWWGVYPGGIVIDPQGPATGSDRIIRGGHWGDFANYCRSAWRVVDSPDYRAYGIGFRVVLAPGQ